MQYKYYSHTCFHNYFSSTRSLDIEIISKDTQNYRVPLPIVLCKFDRSKKKNDCYYKKDLPKMVEKTRRESALWIESRKGYPTWNESEPISDRPHVPACTLEKLKCISHHGSWISWRTTKGRKRRAKEVACTMSILLLSTRWRAGFIIYFLLILWYF